MIPIYSVSDLLTCGTDVRGPFCYLMADHPREPVRMVFFPTRQFHVGAQFVKWTKAKRAAFGHYVVELLDN